MQEVRLNKFLAEAGVCSRREADRLIAAGQVTVDGKRAETGMKVLPTQEIRVGKKTVQKVEKKNPFNCEQTGGDCMHRGETGEE